MDAVELGMSETARKPGKFIAFEGGEGAGKSTQARKLIQALERHQITCRLTREPGGTPGAEAIRDLVLHPPFPHRAGDGFDLRAEALLFAAARADHVARFIRPALADGFWIVCDRYLDSSRAYQGAAGGLKDVDLRALHRIGSGGLLPDLTIVLDAPEEQVLARLQNRDGASADAIGGRHATYHARVTAAFREFAATEPQRFALIDGSGSAEEVHSRVMKAVAPLLC